MPESPRVALGDQFLMAFAALPKAQQRAVNQFVTKFRANPRSPGINYERIRNARDRNFRSVRIDGSYRGIVLRPDTGNVYVLLWIDKHDDAYDWAMRHRCEIHPETGVLQLFEASIEPESESASESEPEADAGTADESEAPTGAAFAGTAVTEAPDPAISVRPLFDLDEATLLRLGVPRSRLELVQGLSAVEALEAAEPSLPIEAFEALYLLAAGETLEHILEEYGARADTKVDTDDYQAALDRAASRRRFYVPESEQELARMLNAPLERWRVFLHPSQRRLVERDWNGPVRVLGGAGTGKTVVAMHRARWLVSQPDWPRNARLLFTTFTRNLAMDIEHNLRKICSPEQMENIEVINLDSWVSQFVRRNQYESRIVYQGGRDGIYDRCWEYAMQIKPAELAFPDTFYHEEWERVVLAQGISSRRDYLFASRTGRGVRLSRRQRADLWPVFEEMREQLAENSCVTAEDAIYHARAILAEGADSRRYHAVIVDETQDFGQSALALLRDLAGPQERKNDMFLVGDAHQRIYGRQTSMSACGINIIGRGRKLRINYRTTERIRDYAVRVLANMDIDDLDDGQDTATGYRSIVMGEPPAIYQATTFDDELNWIVDQVRQLQEQSIPLREIALVARTNGRCTQYAQGLEALGIPVSMVSRQRADSQRTEGVRIATMHRVKGLEFRYVFIAAVNEGVVPLRVAMARSEDVVEQSLHELNERALFHVAATRAISGLYVSSHGRPSPWLS